MSRFAAFAASALTLIGVCNLPTDAAAQVDYPNRPIRIVVGFAAGTAPDIVARILGDKLQAAMGKPIVVEDITGAAGNLAGDRVAKSSPDGYSLILAANSGVVINPNLYRKMSYDPVTDLVPITQVFSYANVLVVNKSVPASTPQELAALARAQPGILTYGSPGVGTTIYLASELFASMEGLDIAHIPFRGSVITEVIAQRVTMAFSPPITSLPPMHEGLVKGLAVTSLRRIASAPDIPTMDESGFPGFDITVWFGLMAPAKTPVGIIDRLHRETVKVLSDPAVRKRLEEAGLDVMGNSPQEFAAAIAAEAPRWAKFIRKIGVRLD
jgi:tripartite-type tricarboxylate transporter receptor subunit TctC